MNKIININLAGRLIPIDEAAYDQLHQYLNRLKTFFAREEGGDEIVRDMEDRIGELFQDKLKKGVPCILVEDIQSMMSVMGSPEQIESEAGEDIPKQEGYSSEQEKVASDYSKKTKHLSRSKKDSLVGGVCGGIAQYFQIDPIIIRIAFAIITLAWGTGILVYLLLWAILPLGDGENIPLKRRLYRNPQNKVVGGVCSGIAAYSNIDPIIPRVLFVAPLLGLVFFGILNDDIFFFPMFIGGLPTLTLLYLVLWASLPEANTIAEKLEMRGEKVDVQNLSLAMKGHTEKEEKGEAKSSGLRRLLAIILKIFVFFVLAVILLALTGVIIGIFASLLGLASASIITLPLKGLVTDNEAQSWLLWICITLVLVIPFLAILRLFTRVVTGRNQQRNKWVNISFSILFIAGIFGIFWIGGSILNDFKTRYRKTDVLQIIQPLNDTLIVKQVVLEDEGIIDIMNWDGDNEIIRFRDDSTLAISNINLRFAKSPDSLYHLSLQRSAYGKNSARARSLIEPVTFNYKQEANTLYLPQDFTLPAGNPFRGQQLKIEIQVPVGKTFRTENISSRIYLDHSFLMGRGNFKYYTKQHHYLKDGQYYKMEADGPVSSKNLDEDEEIESRQDF